MGWNLSSDGGLTESQMREANQLGMTHREYKDKLLERYEKRKGKTPRRVLHGVFKDKIKAKNPVLVIGHGPSYLDNMKYYNKFDIPKLVVEVSANDCFRNNVIPNYIITLETNKKYVVHTFFDREKIRENGTKVIGSFISRDELGDFLQEEGCHWEKWEFDGQEGCSNVGLMACIYARDVLKADACIISGFEHLGSEYSDYDYRIWQTDFFRYVRQHWPKEFIVNVSGRSALYYKDFIIDTTLDKLQIDSS